MAKKNLITLCIPTFNRSDSVSELLINITKQRINDIANILVIDDGSHDGTFKNLESFDSHQNIKVLANESNLGYARTFLRCFDECESEYLIMCTDDDAYSKEGVMEILDEIYSKKPDFISTSFISDDSARIHKKIKEIDFLDIWDSAKHSPGLVYKTSSILFAKESMIGLLRQNNLAAFFFPQIILLVLMKSNNLRLLTSSVEIASKHPNGSYKTQLTDQSGNVYLSLANVIERHKSFSAFYKLLIEDPLYKSHHSSLKQLLKSHENSLFSNIEAGIALEDSRLIKDFRRGGMLKLINLRLVSKLFSFFR